MPRRGRTPDLESDYSEGTASVGIPAAAPFVDDGADSPDLAEAFSLTVRDAAGERLDRFVAQALKERLPGVSRSRVQHWIALGAVRITGRALTAASRLRGFETIEVQPLPREADEALAPDPVPLDCVHEDSQVAVFHKPAGLVMHPAPGNWRGTLLNGLLHRWPDSAALARAGIVHRLDKDTSGLLMVARTEAAQAHLIAQLSARTVSRRYLALVEGQTPERGTVDAPVGRDPRSRLRMACGPAVPAAREARTHYRALACAPIDGREFTLLECRLETGRTHQIRVHLASIGFPLLGDALYGGQTDLLPRQALHAWRLAFRHPAQGDLRAFWREPPADLAGLCTRLGFGLSSWCVQADRDLAVKESA